MMFSLRSVVWLSLMCGGVFLRGVSGAEFKAVTIDPQPGDVCYAVTAADVNQDGKLDAVVVTEDRVLWYEAPEWTAHEIIAEGVRKDHVCIVPHDIDGDGWVDFALGAGWPRNGGTIQWLSHDRDRGFTGHWNRYAIDAEGWTHRMRFGDVLGRGTPQLVVSALNGNDQHGARLLAFEIPKDPRNDRWGKHVLTDAVQRMHNHWCLPGDDLETAPLAGQTTTLTASQEGISVLWKTGAAASVFERKLLSINGDVVAAGGAGEIKLGRLADGTKILATIEPMHGNAAVAYLAKEGLFDGPGQRHVLDDQLGQGHAVWCADLDGDGSDEVVIGHREPGTGEVPGPGVYVFDFNGKDWSKQIIDDGGMACEDLIVADFNQDGLLDILAGGRATHNVKLYLQQPAEAGE